jgi:hypothetical protein
MVLNLCKYAPYGQKMDWPIHAVYPNIETRKVHSGFEEEIIKRAEIEIKIQKRTG